MTSFKYSISTLLFVVCASMFSYAQGESKSERFELQLKAKDHREGFRPYSVIAVEDTPQDLAIAKRLEVIRHSLSVSNLSAIAETLRDSFFQMTEHLVLSPRRDTRYAMPQMLYSPSNLDGYTQYMRKLALCSSLLEKLIQSDEDLFGAIIYSGENEIHLVEEAFLYKGVFKPKEYLGKNPMPLRVLDDLFMEEVAMPIPLKVGFTENKYQFTFTIPLVYQAKYIGDLLLNYLK